MSKAVVEVYYWPQCPFCKRALELLGTKKDINIEKIDTSYNEKLKAKMSERAHGKTTVPQIFIDNEHIGGCDELLALESSSTLDKKLYK